MKIAPWKFCHVCILSALYYCLSDIFSKLLKRPFTAFYCGWEKMWSHPTLLFDVSWSKLISQPVWAWLALDWKVFYESIHPFHTDLIPLVFESIHGERPNRNPFSYPGLGPHWCYYPNLKNDMVLIEALTMEYVGHTCLYLFILSHLDHAFD